MDPTTDEMTGPSSEAEFVVDGLHFLKMPKNELADHVYRQDALAEKQQKNANQLTMESAEKDEEIDTLVRQIRNEAEQLRQTVKAQDLKFSNLVEKDAVAYAHSSPNTLRDLDFGIRRT
eukprot:SAG31_NODE_5546_length_2466_cov_1.041825_1_plen_118_part_10